VVTPDAPPERTTAQADAPVIAHAQGGKIAIRPDVPAFHPIVWMTAVMLLAGCGDPVHEVWVRNDSAQPAIIRVHDGATNYAIA
jgi:hypothetical protein